MSRPGLPLLERTAFYVPVPIIALTDDNRIADFNLAANTLFGPCTDAYRSRHVDELLKEVCGRPDGSGCAADTRIQTVSIELPGYGKGALRCWVADFTHPETGAPWYRVLYTELVALKEMDRFAADLAGQWRQQLTWEAYAISYDKILLRMDYYQEVLSRHCAALSDPLIRRVIDLGAGTGNLAALLLEQSQSQVTVVDSSRAMLERLRAKLGEHIGHRLFVLEQNAESLPQQEDDSFDGVSILLALFDMENPLSALREAIRLLRPGGILIITEPKRCFRIEPILGHVERSLKQAGVFDELEEDFQRVTNVNQNIDPHSRVSRSPLRAEDILEILRDERFEDVTMTDSHFGNCATVTGVNR